MGYSRVSGSTALPKPTLSPNPSLSEFGGSFTNAGGAVGDTQVVAQGPNLINWIGNAADAYTAESLDIQDRAVELQEVLTIIDTELTTYGETFQFLVDTTIPDYQDQWDEAITTHDENIELTQTEMEEARASLPDGVAFDPTPFYTEFQNQHDALEETQNELARLYNSAVCDVDDAAGTAATNIAAALDGYVPRGEDGGLPSRTAVGTALFGDNGGILAAQQHMEQGIEDAEEAVDILSDVDPETGLPTEAAIREFNEEYGERLSTDPFFATAFFEQYSVDGVNAFFARTSQTSMYISEEYRQALEEGVENFGAGLILATGGTNDGYPTSEAWENTGYGETFGIGDHDSLSSWREEFQGEMITAGRLSWNELGESDENSLSGAPGYLHMMQAMSLAADRNPDLALGDSFLNGPNSVAHDLMEWDRETNYNWSPNTLHFPTLSSDYDNIVLDPVQNMLNAMDGGGQPAQTWLTSETQFTFDHDGDRDTDEVSMNMTRYLTGHLPLNMEGENWFDRGDTLGELLNDATSADPQSQTATTIALNFMEGYTDGLAEDRDTFWFGNQDRVNGEDVFGHHNSALRSWAGYILDDYMADIADGMVTPGSSSGVIPNLNEDGYKLVISDELRDQLIGNGADRMFTDLAFDSPEQNEDGTWVGGRPPALNTLIDRSLIEMNLNLVHAMGEDGSDGMIHDANSNWSAVLEQLTTSNDDMKTEVATALDERNAYLQGLINKGVGAIPFSEILTTSGQKYVQGQVDNLGILDMGLEAILSTDNAAQASVGQVNAHNAVEMLVREQFYSAVSQNDYWEGGADPVDTFGSEGTYAEHQMLDADGSFIPYGDMTAEQRLLFEEWVTNLEYGAGERFDEHVHDIEGNLNDAQQEGDEG